ncbi:peptidoglycan-binding domain-containing protein [Psychromarinibacter halotolerans]|uniref:Peptidoglycan-binding domain-containing protein n=1 Tax=Psychromarinibacter halotolerans TaxID=1775175 RepID=A0ABV7GRF4_9RHOB|nr:peptidoglycan-binding domain-containing protein [Psychromarinibacter halotolerans]MDF0595080.1 peptidoglycan-binding domain-containing protein [Psychromarinibacter halotolerans]
MLIKKLIAVAAIAATLASPAQRAAADAGDAILGAIVGGIVTGVVVNEANKNKPRGGGTVYVARPDSPQRAANRVTQNALNYFSFNAGYADGVFGARTAAAVRAYQAFLGFPQTGKLTGTEHDILITAYNRGQAGGYDVTQMVSTDPMGTRALLVSQRNLVLGPPPGSGSVSSTPTVATMDTDLGTVTVPETTTPEVASNDTPMGLPLIPVPTGKGNLAEFCSGSDVTGPRITLAAMTDPVPALNQAFCGARAEAIEASAALASGVQGVSMADIEAQCDALGPVVQSYVSMLNGTDRAQVISAVDTFINDSGTDRGQLASTAQICLGVGYKKDELNVALGSALLLVALDEAAYGELMGHHLYHGFGVSENQNRGVDWLVWTTDELEAGATPVFGTVDGVRGALVDEAVYRLNGGAPSSAAKNTSSKGKLPVINTNN